MGSVEPEAQNNEPLIYMRQNGFQLLSFKRTQDICIIRYICMNLGIHSDIIVSCNRSNFCLFTWFDYNTWIVPRNVHCHCICNSVVGKCTSC